MNSSIYIRAIASGACAAALLCAAAGVSAQSVFKHLDDEGRVTFSDQPPARPATLPRRSGRVDVNEAARRLKQARLERSLGAQPGPGELNQGGGAPSVNQRYWRRQEKLRLVVEQALRRSQETLGVQVASR